jgi:excisionase family DNA binding protein
MSEIRPLDRFEGMAKQLIDIHGVAEQLGVSERHIRRLVFERRIPFIKWGHLLRFDPDEIDRWIDGSRVSVTPDSYASQ